MNLNDLKSNILNKDKVAIVVVGYNRLKSMTRLLTSLKQADYPINDVPLVISIDCSGDQELYSYVSDFEWPYGDKYVNIQNERLGLKNHIFQCGDLSHYFNAIILLEDDLVVSRYFYNYTLKVLEKYSSDRRIAQISLYKNEYNGYVGLPFENIQDGSDVFLMQDVSTWGECWTYAMWEDFMVWLNSHSEYDIMNVDMPDAIKGWTRAWSKYYNAYVVDTGRYVLYPNVSLTTNFSDAGEHGEDNHSIVQVNLQQGDFNYRLPPFENLNKYDIYFCNVDIYNWLNYSKDDLLLDLYGFSRSINSHKFLLSVKYLPYAVIRSYALNMRPIELNIKENIQGDGLYLYDISRKVASREKSRNTILQYFLRGFNTRRLLKYILSYYSNKLIYKIFRR